MFVLSRHCGFASTDKQHDLPVLLIRSNFQIGILGTTCICFDVSRREDYDGVSRFSLSFVVEKLLQKNVDLTKSNTFV